MPTQAQTRNHSLDALRLLAAFCVVGLHVGSLESLGSAWNLARIEMRWAVPFFFVLAGFHLGYEAQQMPARITRQLSRLVVVLLSGSLLFLPVLFATRGFAGGMQALFSFDLLRTGTWFHLWFISAMIVGLLCVLTALQFRMERVLGQVSALVLIVALLSGSYSSVLPAGHGLEGSFPFARHLLAIPCIHAGMLLARSAPLPQRVAIWLTAGGAALQLLEALMLRDVAGTPLFSHQFLIGTLPMTIGIVSLARLHAGSLAGTLTGTLSRWGREYSLGIYIVHPLWILVFDAAGRMAGMPLGEAPLLACVLVFGASLGSMLALERVAPTLRDLLEGRSTGMGLRA